MPCNADVCAIRPTPPFPCAAGASLVKQVASTTNDVAGDGTTTATVLTRAILVEGCKSVAAGVNAMELRRGMQSAVDQVVSALKGMAKMIDSKEEIAQARGFLG